MIAPLESDTVPENWVVEVWAKPGTRSISESEETTKAAEAVKRDIL
jgi:hypothetical protein